MWIPKRLFHLSTNEASFSKRGFYCGNSETQRYLERILEVFIEGYNLSVSHNDPNELVAELDRKYEPHFSGFAFEGTGLYFGLLDLLLPQSNSRLRDFTSGVASKHDYIISVGAGFAVARIPWSRSRPQRYVKKLDPLLAWCVPDGYGFHQGIFSPRKFVHNCSPHPRGLTSEQALLFDSGLGRSIWWVMGADPQRIHDTINQFNPSRRPELWSGIGVALAYAGNGNAISSEQVMELAGEYRSDLLSGVPFACRLRHKGGNYSSWTEEVSQQLLDRSSDKAGAWIHNILQESLQDIPASSHHRGTLAYVKVRESLVNEFLS